MKLEVSRDSRWGTRLLPEAIRVIGAHLARACGGSDRGTNARYRGNAGIATFFFNSTHQTPFPPTEVSANQGLRKVGPDTVVEKLDQPPVPCAPSARPGRAQGADARREARVCAPGCAPENPENAPPHPHAP
eukprot:gene18493-biopygen2421